VSQSRPGRVSGVYANICSITTAEAFGRVACYLDLLCKGEAACTRRTAGGWDATAGCASWRHPGAASAAQYLLDRGADLNWVPSWDQHTPLDMARASGAQDLVEWLLDQGARSADEPR
jgi:hypothetical protein